MQHIFHRSSVHYIFAMIYFDHFQVLLCINCIRRIITVFQIATWSLTTMDVRVLWTCFLLYKHRSITGYFYYVAFIYSLFIITCKHFVPMFYELSFFQFMNFLISNIVSVCAKGLEMFNWWIQIVISLFEEAVHLKFKISNNLELAMW